MPKRLTALIMVLVLAVACTHRVDIAMMPLFQGYIQPGTELSKVEPAISFFQGEFTDQRPDPTKLASFSQGIHTWNLYEQRPVKDAIFEGMSTVVASSKHRWSQSPEGEVKVNVTFLDLQAVRNTGFVSVSAKSSFQIKVELVNGKNGDVIYTNAYTGRDERSQAMVGLMDMVRASIDASMIDCLQGVANDPELVKALQKYRSS